VYITVGNWERERSPTATPKGKEAAQNIAEHRFIVNASYACPTYTAAACLMKEGRGEGVWLDDYFHPQDLYLCLRLVVLVHTTALYLCNDFEAYDRERERDCQTERDSNERRGRQGEAVIKWGGE
jgi:hypothetical protein